MKKTFYSIIITIIGILMFVSGLILLKTISQPTGIMSTLPYILVGLGSGIFGGGIAEIIKLRTIKNHPDIKKQMEINENDERNIAIVNRAKAKAYDIMVFVFGALMLSYALMGTDMVAVLLLVFAYLFVIGCGIFYRVKYDKEM